MPIAICNRLIDAVDRSAPEQPAGRKGTKQIARQHRSLVTIRQADVTPGSVEAESELRREHARDAEQHHVERELEAGYDPGSVGGEKPMARENTGRPADAMRFDSTQQHIPRLQELEREIEERRERDCAEREQ